jgi:hypothetical protein
MTEPLILDDSDERLEALYGLDAATRSDVGDILTSSSVTASGPH